MQSLYRIIKNTDVSLEENQGRVIDTSIETPKFCKTDIETKEDTIDEVKIVKDLEEKLRLEIEEEKIRILEKTKEEAFNLKNEIEKKAYEDGYEKGYEQGYQIGYEDGTTQGLNQGMNEALNVKEKALDLILQSEEYVKEYFEENRQSLIELAAIMAESIVHKTIEISDENIMMILEPILREYGHKGNIIITCHPDNISIVKDKLKELEDISGGNKIVILKDGNLEKNGCTLENSNQVIDLQIETQIKNILKDIENME